MDIQYYKEFADLAQTLNFHQTAAKFFMSQSTLSKHIAALEKKLAVQLFYRSKYKVTLTENGKKILSHVNKLILAHDEILRTLHPNAAQINGHLRIGFFKNAVRTHAVSAVWMFNRKYPDINVQLIDYNMMEIFSELKDDNIDLAMSILVKETVFPKDTVFYPLADDYLCAVVPKDHPLAGETEIMFHRLLEYPLILPSAQEYAFLYRLISRFVINAPIKANIICDYIDIQTALMMVEAGLGITILPHSVDANDSVRMIKLLDCQLDLKIGLLYKTTNQIAGLKEFVEVFTSSKPME